LLQTAVGITLAQKSLRLDFEVEICAAGRFLHRGRVSIH
jgi:hypothetical protein